MDKNNVSVRKLSLGQYKSTVEEKRVEHIQRLAEKISGSSVVHVNSSSFGGGVSEILHRLVSLMQDVGLDAQWKVIEGTNEFFQVTKTVHNALQGMKKPLTEELKKTYLQQNVANASQMELDYDYVVIHDMIHSLSL